MTHKNRLIFIVINDPLVGNVLKFQLSHSGYKEAVLFTTVRECLYVLKKGVLPAFIIADYDLGTMTGEEFLKIVIEKYPDMRILFFSAIENHEVVTQLIHQGAADFISHSSTSNQAITELIKNIRYLEKELAVVS